MRQVLIGDFETNRGMYQVMPFCFNLGHKHGAKDVGMKNADEKRLPTIRIFENQCEIERYLPNRKDPKRSKRI